MAKGPGTNADLEEYDILGWDTVLLDRSPLAFRGNVSPPSSGSKSKPSKNHLEIDGNQNPKINIIQIVVTT
jgi:hypothetical protein